MKARHLALQKSAKFSLVFALATFVLITSYTTGSSLTFATRSFQRSVQEDSQLISQSVRIGDLYTLKKYASSKIKSDRFQYFGVYSEDSQQIIVQAGDSELVSPISFVAIQEGNLLVRKSEIFFDQWNKSWRIRAILKVPLVAFASALLFSLLVCILFYIALRVTLLKVLSRISEPMEALSSDFEANDGASLATLDTPKYEKCQKIYEVDLIVNTVKGLLLKLYDQQRQLQKMEVLEALRLQSKQVSHDIQSPLGALKAATAVGLKNPEAANMVALKAIERITTIIEDLQDRNETSLFSKNNKFFNLHDILRDIGKEKLFEFKKDGLVIQLNLPLPNILVRGCGSEVSRIFSNLINNAIEASSGQPEISIKTTESPEVARVFITDKGSGISPENLQRVVEFGYSKSKNNGSGMGLWHAKKSIESYGGTMVIKSQLGVGTTVEVTFLRT